MLSMLPPQKNALCAQWIKLTFGNRIPGYLSYRKRNHMIRGNDHSEVREPGLIMRLFDSAGSSKSALGS